MGSNIRRVHAPVGPGGRALLDAVASQALPAFLLEQRWFPAKGRAIATVRVEDAVPLATDAAWPALWLIRVAFADGGSDRYAMPVAAATGAEAADITLQTPARVIALVEGAATLAIHDRVEFGLGAALLALIAGAARLELSGETLSCEPTAVFTALLGARIDGVTVRQVTGEQSNTSIIFGEGVILKVVRRLEPGLHPDYEIGRHLTQQVHFPGIPALAGAIVLRQDSGPPTVLAIAQAFVAGTRALREVIVEEVAAMMREQLASGRGEVGGEAMRGRCAAMFAAAAALGSKTGALHLALADAQGDPAFVPEPATSPVMEAVASEMLEQTGLALDVLRSRLPELHPSSASLAARILGARGQLLAEVGRVARVPAGCSRIRVHGDYQLDQVLVADGDLVIIDFEGEPLRSLASRRGKFFAIKDVAGMMRSYSYAAYAGLFAAAGDDERLAEGLDPVARWWQDTATHHFLEGYRRTVGQATFVPARDEDARTLLRAFLVEKATYELRYEIGHRPRWLRIPLRGLTALLDESR